MKGLALCPAPDNLVAVGGLLLLFPQCRFSLSKTVVQEEGQVKKEANRH